MEKLMGREQLLASTRWLGLEIISLLIPIGLYTIVLSNPISPTIPLNLQHALFPGLPIFAALLFFVFQIKGYLGRIASLSLILLLFALPLVALWNTGMSNAFTVGGLLPWTDANIYYWDARLLLQGEPLSPSVDHQRPLATGLLATLLWFTQQNLQLAIALLVFIAASTSFLASRAIQRSHGSLAATVCLIGLYAFYRTFAGSVMTETLGLSLGCLGFAALWYGAGARRIGFALAGLFFFSLGMNARISAIFILPAILLWGTYFFRQNQRFSWRFALNGTGAILSAFLLNGTLRKLIAAPGAVPFSNFSYTLYGLLTRSDWSQIFKDYPDLNQLANPDKTLRAYEIVWQVFCDNPLNLITGVLRAWQEFFFGNLSWFLVYQPKSNLDSWLSILTIVGLVICWRRSKNAQARLMLWLSLGVFLSIPLLPIWDGGLRPYATVIVVFYALPAIGLSFLAEGVVRWLRTQTWFSDYRNRVYQKLNPVWKFDWLNDTSNLTSAPLWYGVLLTLLCTVTPVMIKVTSPPLPPLQNTCPPPLEARYYRINPGSSINLVKNKALASSHLSYLRIKDFRSGLQGMIVYPEAYRVFNTLPPGNVLVDTFGYSWLVAKQSIVPSETGTVVACGRLEQRPDIHLFKAQSIHLLSP